MTEELITKYNVPVPRYTSYPTLPFWQDDSIEQRQWLSTVKRTFDESNDDQGISLYIHLPYCESLCTYCACNTRITKNHQVEESYIAALLKEWEMYVYTFGRKPLIREIHLGGGTPTFFSPENLKHLIAEILLTSDLHEQYCFSFEGHPNNTTREHLLTLYNLGFRRVSYGVQDLDLKVQQTINRLQPFENVEQATKEARDIGYESVNFDLIYGLPFQTEDSILNTIDKVLSLKPDRIAFYSYAHVPWKRPGQRAYTEVDLPDNNAKRKLYEVGKKSLIEHDYIDVGMDHFAIKGDELYEAYLRKTMLRNFMGYTTAQTDLLIGLGTSAISDAKYAYAQNEKNVEQYKEQLEMGVLPVVKGHFLSAEDRIIRQFIIDIACTGEARWHNYPQLLDFNMNIALLTMAQEGLIQLYATGLRVTPLGMAFLRNICAVFDKYLANRPETSQMFSKAI
ncbi:oxygen-independent coproporphyrinogen III oxidase [Fulvivirga sp. RKSG066]|nr:oxygen-independent coproporphyrinogen III oxidase [Fulvivirga aurantia]